ncbi:MAG: peptide chain release factor N(5)-glutamine methyltransferase [Gemmataceae bacterium]|nr:peptide chain release factor N(5)-glutamine methyltransferase [Gemmataceae bacterium]
MAEQVWTLGSLLDWTAKHLAQKECESPRIDAEVLLAHAVGCKRIDLYGMRHGEEASADIRKRYRELVSRRLDGAPVAYLVGKKEFFGLEFKVSPAVLIPRPDTEVLITACLDLGKKHPQPRIVDVGTGSGCIPIALAKHLPKAQVTTIDMSPEATAIGKENAGKHSVFDRVRFLQGDVLEPVASETFEFVVSNPPYIAHEEWAALPAGVRDYEPRLALDGGPGGFDVFTRLIEQARERLVSGGWLVIEIGSPQEKQARAKIEAIVDYELFPTILDGSGHPRVLKARRR